MKLSFAFIGFVALGVAAAAPAAFAGDTTSAAWPQSSPEHLAFFCGTPQAAETTPRGYAAAMERELRARAAQGVDVAHAIADLQVKADCDGTLARAKAADAVATRSTK